MDNKIDKLKTEVNEIKDSLNALKNNVSLSESEKKTQAEALKSQAEATKHKIENEITSLESKTDDDSKKKKEEAETLLNSFNETMALYASILNTWTTNVPAITTQPEDENKWFFWKTKDWVWEQWNDVWDKDKWEKEWGKNLLRTAWFVATWVWAISLAVKWIKKLFWKDKKKEKESDSKESKDKKEEKWFWEKPLWKTIRWIWMFAWIGSGVYYVAHWLYTWNRAPRDMFDWSKEKKLSFDDAMNYCKWAIVNEKGIEWGKYDMNLQYHDGTSEIEAYWERIKINKNSREIEWLDVKFKTYDHMINTAIIIAFLKKNYSWMCSTNDPFGLWWSRKWDLDVTTNCKKERALDWTGKWWRISCIWGAAILSIIAWIRSKSAKVWLSALTATWALWFIWWYWIDADNPMSRHMPELDNEWWKKALAAYLNKLNCWEARIQTSEDVTQSPIKSEVVACMQELQDTETELTNRWWRRKLDAIQDPNNPSRYRIKAYGREFPAEVSWEWENRKIKLLWISWWSPAIKMHPDQSEKIEKFFKLEMPLKEWIYLSSFLWYLLEENNNCIGKWNKEPFFYYWKRFWLSKPWIYFNDNSWDTYILTEDHFKWRMPTVFNNKNLLLDFLNKWIVFNNNISVRRDQKTLKNK